jgi:hypothetical protein
VLGHLDRVVSQDAVGEPDGAVAGEQRTAVALAVAFERSAVPVGGESVGLDDQMGVGPGKVDLVTGDGGADGWARNLVAAAEGEEIVFQVGAGALRRLFCQGEEFAAPAARIRLNDSST